MKLVAVCIGTLILGIIIGMYMAENIGIAEFILTLTSIAISVYAICVVIVFIILLVMWCEETSLPSCYQNSSKKVFMIMKEAMIWPWSLL